MAKLPTAAPKIHTQDSARSAFAVTPHDTNALTAVTRALWIGGAGNLVVMFDGDTAAVTLVGVASGTLLPIQVRIVLATNTTATSIVALV